MSELETLQASLIQRLSITSIDGERTRILESLAKLADVRKAEAEIEKTRAEQAKLQSDVTTAANDRTRFTLTVLAPLLTALVLAGTLILQVFQANQTAKAQRENVENTNLREGLRLASSKQPQEAFSGAVFLSSMLHSQRYGATAKDIAFLFLEHNEDATSFRALFSALSQDMGAKDLPRLIELSIALDENHGRIEEIGKEGSGMDIKQVTGGFSKDFAIQELDEETALVANGISAILRKRDVSTPVSLAGANLFEANLEGIDLREVDLTDANVQYVRLNGADLSNALSFDRSNWADTAWWLASHINKPLLEYLTTNFPFRNDADYAVASDAHQDQTSYAREVARLNR